MLELAASVPLRGLRQAGAPRHRPALDRRRGRRPGRRNEAGKSTLCLVASGLAPGSIGGTLTGGGLAIDGPPMTGKPLHEFATRVGIGFQNPATQLSGVSGIGLRGGRLRADEPGPAAPERSRGRDEALALLGIEALAERDPRRLSGGQAQLVVIASLLAMRPAHLVLDEPTAQLDPEGTRLVGEAPPRLAATGTALLIAEHKTDLLAACATASSCSTLGGSSSTVRPASPRRSAPRRLGRRAAGPGPPGPGARRRGLDPRSSLGEGLGA